MPKNRITTKNSEETKEFAKVLVGEWMQINKAKNSSWLVCLYGDLGGGKTTFVQGLAEELGVKEIVNSPTFLIMKKYISSKDNKEYTLYHFDCYRISSYKEILDLGWEEIINGENNIIAVEWPEKIEKILPKKRRSPLRETPTRQCERLNLEFEFVDEKTRRIGYRYKILESH